jgi:hypothetical protein
LLREGGGVWRITDHDFNTGFLQPVLRPFGSAIRNLAKTTGIG